MNVNKAVSLEEMRKRERGEEEERRKVVAAAAAVMVMGRRVRKWRRRGGDTIIKASFLQRTIKSRPRRAAEHKSISFSRLQAPRF